MSSHTAEEQLAIARSAVAKYILDWLKCEGIHNLESPGNYTPDEYEFLRECRDRAMNEGTW